MSHYKTPDEKLYWLDNEADAARFLPKDAVEITEAEAEQIIASNNPAPNPILVEILRLEASITPRMLRDATLGHDRSRLLEKEAEINALRAKLN